jgi:hypothetical protein
MQQVGVDSNHLRAQPHCRYDLDELTSSELGACLKCVTARLMRRRKSLLRSVAGVIHAEANEYCE